MFGAIDSILVFIPLKQHGIYKPVYT
jgi:hypothetical protein